MRLGWSTLHVRDMEESISFYRDLVGLPLIRRMQTGPHMEIAFLGDGETKIELIDRKDQGQVDVGKDISWGFEVDSVDETINFLAEKGITVLNGPISPTPFMRFFFVSDPNGLTIQFYEDHSPKKPQT